MDSGIRGNEMGEELAWNWFINPLVGLEPALDLSAENCTNSIKNRISASSLENYRSMHIQDGTNDETIHHFICKCQL